MSDYLAVARDGKLRLYSVNGSGALELASVALAGPLPDDTELAAYSAALVHMAQEKPAQRKRAAPPARALTNGRPSPRGRKIRNTEKIRRDVLRKLSDGEWQESKRLGERNETLKGLWESGALERRPSADWTAQARRGRQPYEYRMASEGHESESDQTEGGR